MNDMELRELAEKWREMAELNDPYSDEDFENQGMAGYVTALRDCADAVEELADRYEDTETEEECDV